MRLSIVFLGCLLVGCLLAAWTPVSAHTIRPILSSSMPSLYSQRTFSTVPSTPHTPPANVPQGNKNCNTVQMLQAMQGYAAGDSGNNVARTGYDFSASYPYFNCSTTSSIYLEVVDLEKVMGCAAIKQNLAGYPPWISTVYGTASVENIVYNTDGPNCYGNFIMTRTLTEYVYNRTQTEIFVASFYFGNNVVNNFPLLAPLMEYIPYNPYGHIAPAVLINGISESNNGGSLARYLLDFLYEDAAHFCNLYIPRCASTPGGWATYDACMAYNSATLFTVSPYNIWIPYGDTLACRNYFMAARVGAEQWGVSAAGLAADCAAVGPLGTPATYCTW